MNLRLKSALAIGALALSAALMPTGQAQAGEGKWCAESGGRSAYTNCGYYTFNQCLAAVSGVGGSCRLNPRYFASYDDEYRPRRYYR